MRVGQNPSKSENKIHKPHNITVCTITYIPFISGYFSQSLEVLKKSLSTLWANTELEFDLMVFDNNSCDEVKTFLIAEQTAGRIQYLTLSDKNIGKGGAWNYLFGAAPGSIVAYSDSDIEYQRGWLKQSLQQMNTFPRVGMVTGRPIYSPPEYFTATLKWANETKGVELEKSPGLIAWDIFEQHTSSLGLSEAAAREEFETCDVYKMSFEGCSAFMGAGHFQFVSSKALLKQLPHFDWDKPLGPDRELDTWFNDNDYLRICLDTPLVRHMGNRLSLSDSAKKSTLSPIKRRLLNNKIIRAVLLRIYNKIFKLYFEN